MSFTLHTDAGNFRAFKILIAAEYAGVAVEVPDFKIGTDNQTAEFLAKSPLGRVPVLDTPQGSLFESNAIARYVARLRPDVGLMGANFQESAQVDQWMDFSAHDLELPASLWFYPVLGSIPSNEVITAKAKGDLARGLTVLNNHLSTRTYLVGDRITMADITCAGTLVYPFKFVADPAYRAAYPHVVRWFTTIVNQKEVQAVVGTVVLAEKELTSGQGTAVAAAGGKSKGKGGDKQQHQGEKKEKAPKEAKEKAPKAPKEPKAAPAPKAPAPKDDDEEEPDVPVEKKEDHPFKILDKTHPTPFVMDTWKKTYSNAADYHAAMDAFWATYDPEGWSLFRGDYKYNEECKVLFMTSNLIGGFIQRTEEIRKWLFGTCTIRGTEGAVGPEGMKVTHHFLIRGDSIAPLIKCNDDAECYAWTKLDHTSPEVRASLYDYWCSEGPLDGEACLDSRCYK